MARHTPRKSPLAEWLTSSLLAKHRPVADLDFRANSPDWKLVDGESDSALEEVYFAGGCLWAVQEFLRHLPGVIRTEAGRANGIANDTTQGDYDGYAECVRTWFDPKRVSIRELMDYFFEIIDPYSRNRQGEDVGLKYRTGIYSRNPIHLEQAGLYLAQRADRSKVVVEVLPLTRYVRSDDEHQDRLTRDPGAYCHIPHPLLHKFKQSQSRSKGKS